MWAICVTWGYGVCSMGCIWEMGGVGGYYVFVRGVVLFVRDFWRVIRVVRARMVVVTGGRVGGIMLTCSNNLSASVVVP